jgi:HEAT repeat protein
VENDGVRERAYRTLNLVSDSIKGPKSKPLVPTLIQYLSDDDQRPSLSTVDADTHIPLRHREFVRSVSADILASIGPDAMEAVPALIAALKDKDWSKYHM